VLLRDKPYGHSRWASSSEAARYNPKGAHSNSPGLAAPARLYVCGLQVCPFAPRLRRLLPSLRRARRSILSINNPSESSLIDWMQVHALSRALLFLGGSDLTKLTMFSMGTPGVKISLIPIFLRLRMSS
jgi:hypothetical protein